MLNPGQNEQLRHAAREVLAARPGASLDLRGIRRRIDKDKLVDFKFEDADLRAALSFLLGLEHISTTRDSLGATEYFQATTAGILAFERNQ